MVMAELENRLGRLEGHLIKALEKNSELVMEFNRNQTLVIERLATLNARLDNIPDEEHASHHELLKSLIDERQLRVEFWTEVRKRIATASILATLGLVGSALFWGFTEWLKQNHH